MWHSWSQRGVTLSMKIRVERSLALPLTTQPAVGLVLDVDGATRVVSSF